MTFTEFLEALNETKLLNVIQSFEMGQEINSIIHARLLERLRDYYFVGGMPEAVSVYATTGRYKDVSEVHNPSSKPIEKIFQNMEVQEAYHGC